MMHQSQRSTLGSLNGLLTLSSSSKYGFFLYELHNLIIRGTLTCGLLRQVFRRMH